MDEISLNIIRKQVRKPRPVPFKIVTVDANDGAVWLCVYENEVMSYGSDGQQAILQHMQGLKADIEESGLTVHIIGRPGDPPSNHDSNPS